MVGSSLAGHVGTRRPRGGEVVQVPRQTQWPTGVGQLPECQCGPLSLCHWPRLSLSTAGVGAVSGKHQKPNQPVMCEQGRGARGKTGRKNSPGPQALAGASVLSAHSPPAGGASGPQAPQKH